MPSWLLLKMKETMSVSTRALALHIVQPPITHHDRPISCPVPRSCRSDLYRFPSPAPTQPPSRARHSIRLRSHLEISGEVCGACSRRPIWPFFLSSAYRPYVPEVTRHRCGTVSTRDQIF